MKNRQYTMEDFRRGGLAVAIRNSKERDKFLRLCEENGIRWNNGEKATEFHSPQAYPYAIVCGYFHNGRLTWRGSLRGAISLGQITDSPALHPHYRVEIDCADGKTTVARLLVDGREVKRREARCNPADTFSLRKGAELAFARLWDKKVKPDKPAAREVKRAAKTGEWVKIVAPRDFRERYHCGDILHVQWNNNVGGIFVKGVDCYIASSEYVVLEGYEGGAAYEAD